MPVRLLHTRRTGFSMIESLIAVAITTLAGAALLTSLGAAVGSSTDSAHTVVARGLGDQLMHEIAAASFPTELGTPPIATTRENFADLDDFDGWSSNPPTTVDGQELGTDGETTLGKSFRPYETRPDESFLARFTREVEVDPVEASGSGWSVVSRHTNFRRVIVRVMDTDGQDNTRTLSESTRIFSYVPVAP